MRAKVSAVFCGFTQGEFKPDDGDKIEYCNAAFSVRGTADTFQLKVDKAVNPDDLREYQDNYLLVDMRYDANYKNFKGRIIDLFPTEAAMNSAGFYTPDEPGYVAPARPAAVVAAAAAK